MNSFFKQLVNALVTGVFLIPLFVHSEQEQRWTQPELQQLNCDDTVHVNCGNTPSTFIGEEQKLWVVFEQHGHVYFTLSNDLGITYSPPVVVNEQPEKIYTNGENRPKIAKGKQGEIYISWAKKTEGMYTGEIRFSRSLDGGKTFQKPFTVNNDGLLTSHRFDALQVTESGKVYLAWLDKRDQVAVRKSGGKYSGAALYFAVSDDFGATFVENYKVADNSCECCRIATATYGQDDVVVLWRHIFPESIRDHGFALLKPNGDSTYSRATVDNWKINACPHHGPDMVPASDSVDQIDTEKNSLYHMVWFSNGTEHKGIYYGLHDLKTSNQSQIYSVDASASASHPQVENNGQSLYVAWKLFDGERMHIRLITSSDQGQTWEDKGVVLSTDNRSDHPLLITSGQKTYLAWHTTDEGYRVKAL